MNVCFFKIKPFACLVMIGLSTTLFILNTSGHAQTSGLTQPIPYGGRISKDGIESIQLFTSSDQASYELFNVVSTSRQSAPVVSFKKSQLIKFHNLLLENLLFTSSPKEISAAFDFLSHQEPNKNPLIVSSRIYDGMLSMFLTKALPRSFLKPRFLTKNYLIPSEEEILLTKLEVSHFQKIGQKLGSEPALSFLPSAAVSLNLLEDRGALDGNLNASFGVNSGLWLQMKGPFEDKKTNVLLSMRMGFESNPYFGTSGGYFGVGLRGDRLNFLLLEVPWVATTIGGSIGPIQRRMRESELARKHSRAFSSLGGITYRSIYLSGAKVLFSQHQPATRETLPIIQLTGSAHYQANGLISDEGPPESGTFSLTGFHVRSALVFFPVSRLSLSLEYQLITAKYILRYQETADSPVVDINLTPKSCQIVGLKIACILGEKKL